MSTALGLAMQISANTAQLATAVADVNKRLDSLGDAGKKASNDLSTLKNIEIGKIALGGLQAATTAFLSLGSAVVGTLTSVTSFALSVGAELDALNDLANRTGVGVEALQAYARGVAETGIGIESFAKQLRTVSVAIGAATVDDKAREKFTELGIAFDELKAKTPEKQFEAIVDALASVADPAERLKRATEIFGTKGGFEMGELFTLGPGALAKMREDAEALGGIIDKEAVKSIDNMFDAFAKVQTVVGNLVKQILGELAGPIATIAEDLLGVIKQAGPQQIAQQVAQGLLDFIKMAGNAFFSLAQFIEAFVKKFAPILGLDIRGNEEKNRDKEISDLESARLAVINSTSLGLGLNGLPTLEKLDSRLAELRAAAAEDAAGGLIGRAQASFNSAIDTASAKLDQKIEAANAGEDSKKVQEEQLNELKKLNRNAEPGTVEILN